MMTRILAAVTILATGLLLVAGGLCTVAVSVNYAAHATTATQTLQSWLWGFVVAGVPPFLIAGLTMRGFLNCMRRIKNERSEPQTTL